MTTTRRRLLAGFALTTLTLGSLSACGDDSRDDRSSGRHGSSHHMGDNGGDKTADHNDADAMFAMMMIPHHQQALDMAALLEGRDVPQDFADLVQQIHDAQAPEIEQMKGWLDDWNIPSMAGMHHQMDGMLSDEQMAQLEAAKGKRFVRLWLKGMIAHHQGAIDMADAEIADGSYDEALTLAENIKTSQADEIATMKAMLRDL